MESMRLLDCEIMGLNSIRGYRRRDARGISLAPPAVRHCSRRKRGGLSLPTERLAECANLIGYYYRKLACGKVGWSYAFVERCRASENLAVYLLRVYDANCLGEIISNHVNRGFEIGVARDQHRAVVFVLKGVKEHMGGNIDIRTLFLCFYDADKGLFCIGVGNSHGYRMRKVATKDAFCAKGFKGANIDVLSQWLPGVIWARQNASGKIFETDNLVFWGKNLSHHRKYVKPFVRRSFECAVIKVESVDIYYRSHVYLSKSESRPSRGGPAPVRRSYSGVSWPTLYHKLLFVVNRAQFHNSQGGEYNGTKGETIGTTWRV